MAVIEMVLAMRLEPFQRRALMEAHEKLLAGKLSMVEAVYQLRKVGFSRSQLLASERRRGEEQFPGIIGLGLIGENDPDVKE
jgi:hypothetical protein